MLVTYILYIPETRGETVLLAYNHYNLEIHYLGDRNLQNAKLSVYK